MSPRSEWTLVTPAMAVEYLSRAAPNRAVRKLQVEKYARDMREGRWLATGEALLFTEPGELIDGRHRLTAVVESGETVEFLVVRGVAANAMQVIDSGVARTFADALTTGDQATPTLAKQIAAITRRAMLWDAGVKLQASATTAYSHTEMAEYLGKHPEIEGHAQYGLTLPRPIAASLFGFTHYILSRVDDEKAENFCEKLRTGADLKPGSPILHLRDRLKGDKELVGYHMPVSRSSDYKIALIFNAWQVWRENRSVTKLQLPRGGLSNQNFPTPK